MHLPTYVIHLKTATRRKAHMEQVLAEHAYLDVTYIDAINGYLLSDKRCAEAFDMTACYAHNGRALHRGEIGCTLSHRRCYHRLLTSTAPYVLILEDDICIVGSLEEALVTHADALLESDEPRILLLSGDYWYWHHVPTPHVIAARGSYAYLINRAAAECLLADEHPMTTADDWEYVQHQGVDLRAVCPHIIDTLNAPTRRQRRHATHEMLESALTAVGHHEPAQAPRQILPTDEGHHRRAT